MLSPQQSKMLQEIELSPHKDQLHWIEIEWLENFKLKFSGEVSPCELSNTALVLIHEKATIRGWRLPWDT